MAGWRIPERRRPRSGSGHGVGQEPHEVVLAFGTETESGPVRLLLGLEQDGLDLCLSRSSTLRTASSAVVCPNLGLQALGSRLVGPFVQVAVHIEDGPDRGVAEAIGDHLRVLTLSDEERHLRTRAAYGSRAPRRGRLRRGQVSTRDASTLCGGWVHPPVPGRSSYPVLVSSSRATCSTSWSVIDRGSATVRMLFAVFGGPTMISPRRRMPFDGHGSDSEADRSRRAGGRPARRCEAHRRHRRGRALDSEGRSHQRDASPPRP